MFFYYPYFHVVLESSIILLQEYANFCLRLNKAQFFIDENELIGIGTFPVTTYLVSETQFIFIFKRFSVSKIAFRAASSWLKVVPFGIRRLMNWIKSEYGEDLEVVITENGFSDYQVSPKSLSNAS